MENSKNLENQPTSDIDEETSQKVLSLSKRQLKALGLEYKKEQTERQIARNQKMSEYWKKRHEEERLKKQAYEAEQLSKLQQKIAVKTKPKQKYVTKKYNVSLDDDEDSEELREYQEFQKFKNAKKKGNSTKSKKEESEDEKDGYIQKKAQKATEILETVNKLDTAINKLSSTNPYLGLFNKK